MKEYFTLTSALLQQTHAAASPYLAKFFWQNDFFKRLFTSYVADGIYAPGTVSHYFTGRRTVPHGMLGHYAAYETSTPRCPPRLKADILDLLASTLRGGAVRTAVYFAILSYIEALPELDRKALLEFSAHDAFVTAETLSTFWTAVLWYSICHDLSQKSQGGNESSEI